MLGLTPRRRRRVSNGLAIFGAFLLAASLLAGSGHPLQPADQQADASASPASPQAAGTTAIDSAEASIQNAAGKLRKLRVNLFLIRN